jgi:hypothetical protein
MNYFLYAAKAITAAITAALGAAAAAQVDLPVWVLVTAPAIIAGLAVFLVPNSTEA